MTILALEFSSSRRSVAVARHGAALAERSVPGGRATPAFGLIEQTLAAAGVGREEIRLIAVGLGPGSYTGVRAAIAVAQGWQLARDVRVLGLPSLAAMAWRAQANRQHGRVHLVVDAQRGEFYAATWDISPAQRREISALKIISRDELEQRRQATGLVLGPGEAEPERQLFPDAAALAALAGDPSAADPVAGETLAPIYLRETTFVKAPAQRPI